MSRTAHFLMGLGILALCAIWYFFCFVCFIGNAVARDSAPGATVHDASFMAMYLVGGVGLVFGLWLSFKSLRQALRAPRLDSPPETPAPAATRDRQQDTKTPDDKLAHLVKKTDT